MAKILIVDDAFIARNNLKKILEKGGHRIVAEASSGLQALKLYEKHLPDLVTMDITMPGMTGIEASDKLISQFPNARLIMVTAATQKSSVYLAVEAGAKHYIVKPFSEKIVLDIVEKVLRDTGYIPVIDDEEESCGVKKLLVDAGESCDCCDENHIDKVEDKVAKKDEDSELKNKIDDLLFDT